MESKISKKRTTEHKKELMIDALKANLGIATIACKQAGVGRTQFYEWRKTDWLFDSQVLEIEERSKDFVESRLIDHIRRGSLIAIMFYLNAKARERGYRFWSRKA
jgi:hypothetical protein